MASSNKMEHTLSYQSDQASSSHEEEAYRIPYNPDVNVQVHQAHGQVGSVGEFHRRPAQQIENSDQATHAQRHYRHQREEQIRQMDFSGEQRPGQHGVSVGLRSEAAPGHPQHIESSDETTIPSKSFAETKARWELLRILAGTRRSPGSLPQAGDVQFEQNPSSKHEYEETVSHTEESRFSALGIGRHRAKSDLKAPRGSDLSCSFRVSRPSRQKDQAAR